MKNLLAAALACLCLTTARAQTAPATTTTTTTTTTTKTSKTTTAAASNGTETIKFKTSAVCDMCKARLEKSLAYEKGVQSVALDVPSKVLTVNYRPAKTTPAALRAAVQKTGYDADDLTAEAKAYNRLPECCKKTNPTH